MRQHFDIEASRAAFEAADAEAAAAVAKMAGSADDHKFRAIQRRFSPAKIALRLTVMEALNDGADPDMILGAFGTAAAVVLYNLAEDSGLRIEDVVEDFADYAESALNAMVSRDDEDTAEGTLFRSDAVIVPAGRA